MIFGRDLKMEYSILGFSDSFGLLVIFKLDAFHGKLSFKFSLWIIIDYWFELFRCIWPLRSFLTSSQKTFWNFYRETHLDSFRNFFSFSFSFSFSLSFSLSFSFSWFCSNLLDFLGCCEVVVDWMLLHHSLAYLTSLEVNTAFKSYWTTNKQSIAL